MDVDQAALGRVVEADAIVVGAGPGGAATARHLANRGLDVVLLEKATFPRDKICGDGLTPRVTKQLIRLGIDTSEEAGWHHNTGLRVFGGGTGELILPWPELSEFPSYGLARARTEFDEILARHAEAGGATLVEDANVSEPILDPRTDRIVGVRCKDGREFRAPFVVAADGNSSRLALAMGLAKREDRPMGVAVRTYVESPRSDEPYLDSWLELWDGRPGQSNLLPGYGWAFPLGNGLVNVGLGTVAAKPSDLGKVDYRAQLRRWLEGTPEEWGFRNIVGPVRGAALPMCLNRQPLYSRGLLLVGDAAGMISPFNGEGIAYALEAAEFAADAIAEAHYRGVGTASAEKALRGYATQVKASLGGYFRLGTIFVKLINDPRVMHVCVQYGLPRPTLMKFTMKLLAHLYDTKDGDWMDKVITAATKVVPSA
ncbi:geranylgeranyl reductase family protein [Nigerium massiliense]|uniref:geranylgeranyl reductase family protein n=1 Tax=Nigerium massiliense TaxID=1522317 RepID=UPI000A778368|nr:geranylgeranyl reductase family protein [Nigerium massiliense]